MKNKYKLDEIKKAFYETFHKSGERWFEYLGNEEECNNSTEEEWQDFLDNLSE